MVDSPTEQHGRDLNTWRREWGPVETAECGDVAYEVGSTYTNGRDRVSLVYFVTEFGEAGFGVECRCASRTAGSDDEVVSYEWACDAKCHSLAEAIDNANACARVDESYMFI
jgi:hypothetical protein